VNLETTPWRKIVGNEVLKITGWAWRSERSLWRTIVRVVHSQKMCSRIWQKKRSRHHEFRLDALGEIAELLALRKLVRSGVCPRALASPFRGCARSCDCCSMLGKKRNSVPLEKPACAATSSADVAAKSFSTKRSSAASRTSAGRASLRRSRLPRDSGEDETGHYRESMSGSRWLRSCGSRVKTTCHICEAHEHDALLDLRSAHIAAFEWRAIPGQTYTIAPTQISASRPRRSCGGA